MRIPLKQQHRQKAAHLKTAINFPKKSQETRFSLWDMMKKGCIMHRTECVYAE